MLQKVRDFINLFTQELDEINIVANSNLERWHSFIEELGINPVTIERRNHAELTGLPIPKVAFPSEYRAVLYQLEYRTKRQVKVLQTEVEDDFDADDVLDEFVRRKLNSLTKNELKKYLNASKPAVSVLDIFANASTSLNKYSVKETGDKSYSIKCNSCGASRLEEDQYDECFYCGTPLFN